MYIIIQESFAIHYFVCRDRVCLSGCVRLYEYTIQCLSFSLRAPYKTEVYVNSQAAKHNKREKI